MGLTEFELPHLLVQCTVVTNLQLFLHFRGDTNTRIKIVENIHYITVLALKK